MLYDVSVASRRITIVYNTQRRLYDNLSISAIIKCQSANVGGMRRNEKKSELLRCPGMILSLSSCHTLLKRSRDHN